MSKLNEKQFHSVQNRAKDIQLMIQMITQILVLESQTDLVIVPNGGKYDIYLGDALVQTVSGSFIGASKVLQGIAQKRRTKREKHRHRIAELKIELKYYLSLMDE